MTIKFKYFALNVTAFLLIWVGVDMVTGQLNMGTVNECIAGICMAAMLYMD